MKWLSWRGQFIEFSLSWEILGLSSDSMTTYLSTPPSGFECIYGFGSEMGDVRWHHSIPTGWPGTYTSLSFTQAKDNSSLRVCIDATPDDKAGYSNGLRFLAKLLTLPHQGIQNISLVFNGDGYSAEVIQPLTEECLRLLLSDVDVEMDDAIDAPWQHVYLPLGLENRPDSLFVRRL